RPTRTLISVAGGGLGVILICLITGLVRGVLNERVRREQEIGAEIQFWRIGATTVSASKANPLDFWYARRFEKIAGVRIVSPVGHFVQKSNTGLGFEVVDGIELETYSAISNMRIVEGRAFQSDDEVIIDEFKARRENRGVGSEIRVFGKTLKVAGIYSPQIGSRI